MTTLATFTVKLTINDRAQLIAAGRRAAMAAGYSDEEAEHIVKDFDVHAALTWCLIPAPDIVPGVDIVDSFSETAS